MTAATVEAVVSTDGRARSVRLEYRHAPTLIDVVFEVLQAGTPPEVCGLGRTVQRRILWAPREAQRNLLPPPDGEGGVNVAPPKPRAGSRNH